MLVACIEYMKKVSKWLSGYCGVRYSGGVHVQLSSSAEFINMRSVFNCSIGRIEFLGSSELMN